PGIEFGVFDVMEGPLPGEPYDLICLFEVIEHLEDPGAALENLKASLRPGGLVVLSTPNSEDGDTGSHPYHVYQFSQETLAGLLRKHFELVEVYSQGAPKRRRALEERKEGSALVRLLRRLDVLHLRDRVPFGLRRMAIRGATGVDLKEVREEVHTIDPEPREDARWTVAVCG
ncbi:MAG: class I SAM-dependent methyltransferase, partial [Acidobacteriota bacterium]